MLTICNFLNDDALRQNYEKNNISSDCVSVGISKEIYCDLLWNSGSYKTATCLNVLALHVSVLYLSLFFHKQFKSSKIYFWTKWSFPCFFFNCMKPGIPWDLPQIISLVMPLMFYWIFFSLLLMLCLYSNTLQKELSNN